MSSLLKYDTQPNGTGNEMPTRDFGAVCDTSVLTDRKSFNRAQDLFASSGLYIPSPTYSWLSRSQLIQVRGQTVKYSLLKQLVRERELYPIHLPKIYDEIGRQIMFETNYNVSLTDIRALLLSSHLQIPVITFDDDLINRVSKEIGIKTIHRFEAHSNWLAIRGVLQLYRELSFKSSKRFHEQLEDELDFPKIISIIKKAHRKEIKNTEKSTQRISQGQKDSGVLDLHYLGWNILPCIQEYHDQAIVRPSITQQICERAILLIAKPAKHENPKKMGIDKKKS
ncbi:hypothetical protein AKJ64_01765 [candidate division MSBL1 archaeon SCGC-AAA259E17]|uniref:PIN domain-containing protein n=1 Tax=candidate division MSBL1 archaeon SCGC-AAA259E17 TaxID=1698263 RepID=A0A133UFF3_9EURY|nr:hypothetical protein AKJ64_01765 [candidate division MSBL1 archaeon SCGC-AAA259E17]